MITTYILYTLYAFVRIEGTLVHTQNVVVQLYREEKYNSNLVHDHETSFNLKIKMCLYRFKSFFI